MTAHVKNHTTAANNNKKFGEKLGTIGRKESYDKLQAAFSSVSEAIGQVADARKELLGEGGENGGSKLLGRLEETSKGVIKPSKALVADRTSKVKAVEKEVRRSEEGRTAGAKDDWSEATAKATCRPQT